MTLTPLIIRILRLDRAGIWLNLGVYLLKVGIDEKHSEKRAAIFASA